MPRRKTSDPADTQAAFWPVPFDPVRFVQDRSQHDPDFRRAFELLDDEFRALDVLLRARKEAGLSQAEVARRMGIAPASLARIEASAATHQHTPSLQTLRRYAAACGKKLAIGLV
jgi:DNA-binding XRE family transcriptional regulator